MKHIDTIPQMPRDQLEAYATGLRSIDQNRKQKMRDQRTSLRQLNEAHGRTLYELRQRDKTIHDLKSDLRVAEAKLELAYEKIRRMEAAQKPAKLRVASL